MGVSLKPNTTFDLSPIQMMTSEEIQVLTLLDQPIIGPQAVSLFTTLNTLALKKQEQSLTHHLLLQLLNTNIEEFLEWRYKLEAVGLVSVYITEESHHITYVLKRPMKARAFFSDGIINVFLNFLLKMLLKQKEKMSQNHLMKYLIRRCYFVTLKPYKLVHCRLVR